MTGQDFKDIQKIVSDAMQPITDTLLCHERDIKKNRSQIDKWKGAFMLAAFIVGACGISGLVMSFISQ